NAADDRTRLTDRELSSDEHKEAAASLTSASTAGIPGGRVPTYNSSCYRSHDFHQTLGEQIKHKRPGLTGPRAPERLNVTTEPHLRNAPLFAPTTMKSSAQPASTTGYTPAIATATPHSATGHQPIPWPT